MSFISAPSTAFTKWVFPVIWCVGLIVLLAASAFDGTIEQDPLFLLAPASMLVIGLALFRVYIWNLADSVADHGTYLVARRRGVEARIAMDNIMNVDSSTIANVRRVVLRLVSPTALGSEITFIPKTSFSLNPFAKVAVAESLMERAFAARSKRTT